MSDLPDDHVICPGCAHHFDATPQSAKDHIASLTRSLVLAKAQRDRAILRSIKATGQYWHPDQDGPYHHLEESCE